MLFFTGGGVSGLSSSSVVKLSEKPLSDPELAPPSPPVVAAGGAGALTGFCSCCILCSASALLSANSSLSDRHSLSESVKMIRGDPRSRRVMNL